MSSSTGVKKFKFIIKFKFSIFEKILNTKYWKVEHQNSQNSDIIPLTWYPLRTILAWLLSAWLVDPMAHNLTARSSLSIRRYRKLSDNLSVKLSDILSFFLVFFWHFFASISSSCLKIACLSLLSLSHLDIYFRVS